MILRDGEKIDDTNEEIALDAYIFQLKVIALFNGLMILIDSHSFIPVILNRKGK